MILYLILLALILIIGCVIRIVELSGLILMLNKERALRDAVNPMERDYQFIKGLY